MLMMLDKRKKPLTVKRLWRHQVTWLVLIAIYHCIRNPIATKEKSDGIMNSRQRTTNNNKQGAKNLTTDGWSTIRFSLLFSLLFSIINLQRIIIDDKNGEWRWINLGETTSMMMSVLSNFVTLLLAWSPCAYPPCFGCLYPHLLQPNSQQKLDNTSSLEKAKVCTFFQLFTKY